MAKSRLTTTRWTPPGVYLGRQSIPRPTPPLGSRKICLIGRGSRLKNILDAEITRSKVFDERIEFSPLGSSNPTLYQAQLAHRAKLDKSVAFLVNREGQVIGPANWQFQEAEDIDGNGLGYALFIQLKAAAYVRGEDYFITYQSIDRDILDPIPWAPALEMRGFLYCGDQPQSHQYEEFQDFVVTMSAPDPYDITTDPTPVSYLELLKVLDLGPGFVDPGLTDAEFLLDVANHRAGTYKFDIVAVTPSGPGDGSIQYSVSFRPLGSSVFTLISPTGYTAVIPASAGASDPVRIVIDDQLTTVITKANCNGLVADIGNFFFLTASPYSELQYHPSFFDADGRPRYSSKDTRTIDFTIVSVIEKDGTSRVGLGSPPLQVPGLINYAFTSSTQEGGFGTFTVARPGTSGGGAGCGITAPLVAQIVGAAGPFVGVSNGTVIIVVVDGGTAQVVTLTGCSPAATAAEIVANNTQLTGVEFYEPVPGSIGIRTIAKGGDHTLQVTAPPALGLTDSTVNGTDAVFSDAIGDFGVEFVGRHIVLRNCTNPANNGTFLITARSSATSISIRNDVAVTESPLPSASTYSITSPEQNFNLAPFRDGIVFNIFYPQNAVPGQHTRMTITNEHTIDWSLVSSREEIMAPDVIFTDQVGLITGTAAMRYILLADIPNVSVTRPLVVKNQSGVTKFTVTSPSDTHLRLDANGELTSVVSIPGYDPIVDGDLTVDYFSRGAEPSPGQIYYFSASILRPLSDYNSAIDLASPDEAANFLAPSMIDNHLYIAAKIAYNQVPAPTTISVVQVYDADQDGVYTNLDYKNAIQASQGDLKITDRIVLSHFGSLLDLKTTTIAVNDPFVKGWALDWQGMTTNSQIGSEKVPDSIVYTAKKTLQVQGDNCARGAFILVPNRWCKFSIQLNDGSQQQLVLDGSFLAVAGAAKTSGFSLPRMTLLRQSVDGFDDIEVFSDTDLQTVGAASTAYIQKQGSGWIWGESVTVDTSDPALNEISGRTQEQFVSRYVVDDVDARMVGVVADSARQLEAMTVSAICTALLTLHSSKIVADWTDDAGNVRPLDTTSDVEAAVDENDPRKVYFNYWYNIAYPGKRFNGLYSVGKNAFASQTNS